MLQMNCKLSRRKARFSKIQLDIDVRLSFLYSSLRYCAKLKLCSATSTTLKPL